MKQNLLGIIVNNIGTPAAPTTRAVARYLGEFLSDPDVIPLPTILRYALVYGAIVPLRAPASAAKYREIWTPAGSPLLTHTQDFAQALEKNLAGKAIVEVGMHYGQPNIRTSVEKLIARGATSLLLCPMYPQHAQATYGAGEKKFQHAITKVPGARALPVRVLPEFFSESWFIDSWARLVREKITEATAAGAKKPHVLFSFHGLPVNQITKVDGCELSAACCAKAVATGKRCYRAHSLYTAEKTAAVLGLQREQWSFSFQSRLGPTEWLAPATHHQVQRLTSAGVQDLIVACPSFVADCLETLEEISIGLRAEFTAAGGRSFSLVACPNSDSDWVKSFAGALLQQAT